MKQYLEWEHREIKKGLKRQQESLKKRFFLSLSSHSVLSVVPDVPY